MQNSITRRDFGKLALVGAGSLLLADGLTLLPSKAFADTVKTDTYVQAVRLADAGFILNDKVNADNCVVEALDTDSGFVNKGYGVVYEGYNYTSKHTFTNVARLRWPNSVFWEGELGDLLCEITSVVMEPDVFQPQAGVYGYFFFGTDGYEYGIMSYDFNLGNGPLYGGCKITCRCRLVRHGTTQLMEGASTVHVVRDLDQPDKRWRLHWGGTDWDGWDDYSGEYAEAVRFVSGYVGDDYVGSNSALSHRADGRWSANVYTDGAERWTRAGVARKTTNDFTFEWWTSGASTRMEIALASGPIYDGLSWTPAATKVLDLGLKSGQSTSRRLQANEFTFELRDESGNLLQTKKNAADGSVAFDRVEYRSMIADELPKTFKYTITELAGSDAKTDHDSHVCTLTVTIAKDGSVKESISGSKTFTNIYHPEGNVTVRKVAAQPQLFS